MKIPAPANPRAVAVTSAFALMLVFALALTAPAAQPGGGTANVASLSSCVQVDVAVAPDDAASLQPLIAAYEKASPKAGGRCAAFRIEPRPAGSVADTLVAGWKPATDGPAPVVWLPGSSIWVSIVRARVAAAGGTSIMPSDVTGFAQSPFVIAMPKPMAEALGWPSKQLGFSDLVAIGTDPRGWGSLGHPEWGGLRLGKTNPLLSTTGLEALIAAYFAASHVSQDLTADNLADPKVVAFVKGVELATVHYGESDGTFLQNLAQADDAGQSLQYVSAIALQERQMIAYNQGRFSLKGKPPTVPLAAIYPKEGTLISDNPFVVLDAPWVSDAQRQAAAGLLSFLAAPAQQAALVQAGYRDASGKVAPSPAGAGTLADQPKVVIKPPSGGVLAKVQASWWNVRKPARVLLIVDTSGSMDDVVQGSNTKLDLVKAALLAAIGQVGDDDELGLWSFSDQHHELVPVGRVGSQRDKLKAAIAGLRANGGTLLYQSVLDGWNYVRQTADPRHISAVVVLTDGQDNGSPDGELNKLTSSLSGQPAAGSVRVFTVGYGHDADKADLTKIATSARGEAYDASDPTLIREVFLAVLSNF